LAIKKIKVLDVGLFVDVDMMGVCLDQECVLDWIPSSRCFGIVSAVKSWFCDFRISCM